MSPEEVDWLALADVLVFMVDIPALGPVFVARHQRTVETIASEPVKRSVGGELVTFQLKMMFLLHPLLLFLLSILILNIKVFTSKYLLLIPTSTVIVIIPNDLASVEKCMSFFVILNNVIQKYKS